MCPRPSTPSCWSGHCPASAHSAWPMASSPCPTTVQGVHAGPGYQSCGALADHLWLCPHPQSSLGALLLAFWWGGPLCLATHPVPWAVSLPRSELPGCLKGLTTRSGVTMDQEGHEGHLCPLLSTGREGGGTQKQPCRCCQPSWPCPGPHTPTRHCPPFRGQTVLEQGLHWHGGQCGHKLAAPAATTASSAALAWATQGSAPGLWVHKEDAPRQGSVPKDRVHKEDLNPVLATQHHNTLTPKPCASPPAVAPLHTLAP